MTAADLLLNLAAALDGIPIPCDAVIDITIDPRTGAVVIHLNRLAAPTIATAVCDLSKMESKRHPYMGEVNEHNTAPIKGAPNVSLLWLVNLGPVTTPTT